MCTEQSAGNGDTTADAGAAKPMVAAANAVAADRAKVNFFISTPSVTFRTEPTHRLDCPRNGIRNPNVLLQGQISAARYSRQFRFLTKVTSVISGAFVTLC